MLAATLYQGNALNGVRGADADCDSCLAKMADKGYDKQTGICCFYSFIPERPPTIFDYQYYLAC